MYLDQVLSTGEALSMQSARAEAMMLHARLAERDKNFAAARAALFEAQALAAPLDWLPLEQRINAEIRHLSPKANQ